MLQTSAVRRTVTAALALSLSVGLMACGGPKAPSNITSVTVSAAKTSLAVGESTQATANVTVTNNAAKTVTWSTSNPAVASVDATGMVMAKAVGTADITATSTVDNSKKGKVTITVTAAPAPTAIKVAFQAAGSPAPAGYTVDTGAAFNGTSGWVAEGTATPLDMSSAARYRNPSDTTNVVQGLNPQQYGAILMDCGDVTTGTTCSGATAKGPAGWEYTVANGTYSVLVSVGDADKRNVNSSHVIRVEGTEVIAATTPAAGAFATNTKTVTVSDGRLSVDSAGGKNTKINYIEITPAP